VILLDTNAAIWIDQNHPRARVLGRRERLYLSPVTLLELQMLLEGGRIRLRRDLSALVHHHRWLVDDPPALAWFEEAAAVGGTPDPFDRLILAHAQLRGWRLATGDTQLLDRLPPSKRVAL
jgi:PIN domain nuclease of toxin-antitoxin system